MPQALPFLIAYIASNAAAAIGASVAAQAAIAASAAAIGGALNYVVITVGLSLLAGLFAPRQPRPSDQQTMITQATAPRFRSYGRVKVSGLLAFADPRFNWFYRVIAMGSGLIDAVEEHWIDQHLVTVDPDGSVPEYFRGVLNRAYIFFRLGTDDQAYYDDLETVFGSSIWNSDFQGNGFPHALFEIGAVPAEHQIDLWPNGVNTNYRQVQRAALLFDPNDAGQDITDASTWTWDENAAKIVLDFLIHPDGLRLDTSWITNAIDDWKTACTIAAEDVDLKAGGTEQRWRASGSYNFDERPADVLSRFLLACDGVLMPTPGRGLTLKLVGGTWEAPTVTLGPDAIVGLSGFGHGRDALTTANVIRAQYTDRRLDYKETDADPWVDDDDVAARGEISASLQFLTAPSHSQCRRLMKLAAWRANPNWTGTLSTNLLGMAALGERFIHVTIPDYEVDEDFEIAGDPDLILTEENVLVGLTIPIASISEDAYSWDPETEEGTAPAVPEDIDPDNTVDPPTGLDVTMKQATDVPYAELTWTPLADDTLTVEAQGSLHGMDDWFVIPADTPNSKAISGTLQSGEEYDFQVRAVTLTGRVSDWSTIVTETAIGDPTAPGIVTNVSATGLAGEADLTWKAPNSGNFAKANVYRHTSNVFIGATLIDTEFGAPKSAQSFDDTGLAAGTYYYWITAANGSSVESAEVATGAVVVT